MELVARARRAGEARGGAGTARAMDDILGDILGDDDDGILGGDEEVDEEEEERDEGEVTDAHAVKVDDPELLALSEEAAADQAARDAALATEMIADVHASEALTAGMIADVNNFTVQWTARFEPHILKQTAVRPYSTPSSTGQPTTGSTGAGSTWMSREDWRADKSVDAPRDLPSGTESRLMNAACARACMPQLSTLLALGTHEKNMKRSGAEQLLLIWSGCGGRLNRMGWQSRLPSAVAVETRPAIACLVKVPLHRRLLPELSCRATASIGLGAAQAAMQQLGQTVGCCMCSWRHLAVWWAKCA